MVNNIEDTLHDKLSQDNEKRIQICSRKSPYLLLHALSPCRLPIWTGS